MIGCITSFNASTGNGIVQEHATGLLHPFTNYTGPALSYQLRVTFNVDASGNAIQIQPVLIDGIGTVVYDVPSVSQRNAP